MGSERTSILKQQIEDEIQKEERIIQGAVKLKEALQLNEEMSEVILQKCQLSIKKLKKTLEDIEKDPRKFRGDVGIQNEMTMKPLKEQIDNVVSSELEEHYKRLLGKEKDILGGFQKMQVFNDSNKGSISDKQFRDNIDVSKSKIKKYEMIIKREEVQKLKSKLEHERMLHPQQYQLKTNTQFPKYTIPKLYQKNEEIIEYRIYVMKTLLTGCEKMTISTSHKKTREKLKLEERNIKERLDLLQEAFDSFRLGRQATMIQKYPLPDIDVSGTFILRLVGVSNLATNLEKRDPRGSSLAIKKESANLMRPIIKSSRTSEAGMVNLKIFIDNRLILNTPWSKPSNIGNVVNDETQVKLEGDRQIVVEVFYNDYRSLCGIGFLPLCEFIDSNVHLVRLPLEPCGEVYFRASYQDPKELRVGIKRGKHVMIRTVPQMVAIQKPSLAVADKISFKTDDKKESPRTSNTSEENLISPTDVVSPNSSNDSLMDGDSGTTVYAGQSTEDFEVLKLVGKGCFGAVFRVRHKTLGREAALKVISKGEIVNQNETENFIVERDVLLEVSRVYHPFLVQMYTCFQDEYCLYFVMALLKGGDMLNYVIEGMISEEGVRFYSASVILALEFLHKRNIAYRDLKLENIMMDVDGYIKLADFGLCKMNMGEDSLTTTFCGTPSFMAPEIVMHRPYTKAVDWWSFGVLIYEMYYSTDPFDCNNEEDDKERVYYNIKHSEPEYSEESDQRILNLMKALLMKKPKDRLGSGPHAYDKIKKHPYFSEIDFDKLYEKKLRPPLELEKDRLEDDSYFDETCTCQTPLISAVVKQVFLTDNDQKYFSDFDVNVRSL